MPDKYPYANKLPPSVRELARDLGSAKRQELMQQRSAFSGLSKAPYDIRTRAWTQHEDRKVFQAARKYGNNWAKIVTRFKDRTQNEIKNRWEYLERLAQEKGITLRSTGSSQATKIAEASALAHPTFSALSTGTPQVNANRGGALEAPPTSASNGIDLGYYLGHSSSTINQPEGFDFSKFFDQTFPTSQPTQQHLMTTQTHFPTQPSFMATPADYLSQPNNVTTQVDYASLSSFMTTQEPTTHPSVLTPQVDYLSHPNLMATGANPFYPPTQTMFGGGEFLPLMDSNGTYEMVPLMEPSKSAPQGELGVQIPAQERLIELATTIYNNPHLLELLLKIHDRCGGARRGTKRSSQADYQLVKRGRGNHPSYGGDGNLLLYQLANTDFPEELESDCDFEENESEGESDANFKASVSVEELNELMTASGDPLNASDKEEEGLFTLSLLRRIRSQQKQNLQLVLQAYALECSFRGPTSDKAEYWKTQAVRFAISSFILQLHIKRLNDFGMRYSTVAPGSSPNEFMSFLAVAGAEHIQDILDMMANPPENILCLPNDVLASRSCRSTPAIDKGRGLAYFFPDDKFAAAGSPKALVEKARQIYILCKTVLEPIFVESVLPFFFFTKNASAPSFLRPRTGKPNLNSNFSLFALALNTFADDWPSIRSHFLPVRSDRQLENRYNNMKSRRIYYHPIQTYHHQATQPLTEAEVAKLLEGVERFGKNFRRIQHRLLPKRPIFFLKKAYRDLDIRKPNSKRFLLTQSRSSPLV
ncbi:Myb- protein A [Massospora cicadina]|nr:Myb- protein A [Massospora cicadina]